MFSTHQGEPTSVNTKEKKPLQTTPAGFIFL
jgi:hypothetical protein